MRTTESGGKEHDSEAMGRAMTIRPGGPTAVAGPKKQYEYVAQRSLNHPHICTLFDVSEENGVHYLVMEHVDGETLQQRLEKGRLPLHSGTTTSHQCTPIGRPFQAAEYISRTDLCAFEFPIGQIGSVNSWGYPRYAKLEFLQNCN